MFIKTILSVLFLAQIIFCFSSSLEGRPAAIFGLLFTIGIFAIFFIYVVKHPSNANQSARRPKPPYSFGEETPHDTQPANEPKKDRLT